MFQNKIGFEKILLAGPWTGEFGWELLCWQGYIRFLSKNYDKTIVLTRKGNEILYSDFTKLIHTYEAQTKNANMWYGETNNEINKIIANIKYTDHFKPTNIGFNFSDKSTNVSERFKQQIFLKFKSDVIEKNYDIIFHPRNRVLGNERNWSKDNFQKLINLLKKDGYTMAMIGAKEAMELDGIDNYKNISTSDMVSLMNRTKLVVGPSSGPMHLASLSYAPHLVWGLEIYRSRYMNYWNPHKTPCYYLSKDNWNPSVNDIYNEIKKIL